MHIDQQRIWRVVQNRMAVTQAVGGSCVLLKSPFLPVAPLAPLFEFLPEIKQQVVRNDSKPGLTVQAEKKFYFLLYPIDKPGNKALEYPGFSAAGETCGEKAGKRLYGPASVCAGSGGGERKTM
jgi:hypothetical protein